MLASTHRIARHFTLAGLVLGATALVALIAWTCDVRAAWDPVHGFPASMPPARSFIHRGFRIIARAPDYALGATIAGAIAAAGIALAIAVWRRLRWGLLAAGIGSLLVIVVPWLARAYVVYIETITASRSWAARSPYVAAATSLAVACTIFLALLALAAIIGFATTPPAPPPRLTTGGDRGSPAASARHPGPGPGGGARRS